ncbi:MAG: SpoIVB peptidase [Clostridia bacterium]
MYKFKTPNSKLKYIVAIAFILSIIYIYGYMRSKETVETMSKQKILNEDVKDMDIVLGGEPTGIRLLASGVLVMGIDYVDTASGQRNTLEGVNLSIGDIILEVNDIKVETNEELMQITKKSNGQSLKLRVCRKGKEHITNIVPALSKTNGQYKLGLWVKDSSAGVGIITFYDRKNKNFAGLGHGITETKENYILPILTGGLVKTSILNVNKGYAGKPGDLRGTLTTDVIAQINLNTEYGIYGKMLEDTMYKEKNKIDICLKNKIKEGKAYIYTCINGSKPQKFEIKIIKVIQDSTGNKNMVIEVTDKKLLEITGGIVQGMSGSPILQGGKLIGAVTHVFLNEPTRGYGVFIENMIRDMNSMK